MKKMLKLADYNFALSVIIITPWPIKAEIFINPIYSIQINNCIEIFNNVRKQLIV